MVKPLNQIDSKFGRLECLYLSALCISYYLLSSLQSLQGPFYPIEAEKSGVTPSAYGFVLGFYQAISALLTPILGIYMEKFGVRACFISSIFLLGISAIFLSFLDYVHSYYGFLAYSYIVRGLDGVGGALFFGTMFTNINIVFRGKISTVVSFTECAGVLGVSTGPILGSIAYQSFGFMGPFLCFGIPMLMLGILLCLYLPELPEVHAPHNASAMETLAGFVRILRVPSVALFLFSAFTVSMGINFIQATLQPQLQKEQFNLSQLEFGLAFSLIGVLQILDPLWGYLILKFKRGEIVTLFGAAACTIGVMLLGPASFLPMSPTIWLVIIALVLFGLGAGALMVSNFTKVVEESTRNGINGNMSDVIAISCYYSISLAAGAAVGPSVGGILMDTYGFRKSSIFLFCVFGILCLLLLMFIQGRGFVVKRTESGCGWEFFVLKTLASEEGDCDEKERLIDENNNK